MKSKITIELDFSTGKPYLRVINDHQSDDVRDKLIRFFKEQFGYTSSWCKINFRGSDGDLDLFVIDPISPEQLEAEAKLMRDQADLNNKVQERASIQH